MNVFHAFVLGAIQGITEFLPVSSSAHLDLAHKFFGPGWNLSDQADLVFDVALHFGTLVAIVIYFFHDWVDFFKRRDRLVAYVLVACIPGGIAGVLFEKKAATVFREPWHIAIFLAAMGLVLAAAEKWSPKRVELDKMSFRDALWIGISQALAIMPGVSRAGITMTTGLFVGLTREAAARFSFLLATPILLGASLWEGRHLIHGMAGISAGSMIVGVVTSAVVGLLCINFLLAFLRKHSFYPFVIYRLAMGLFILALSFFLGR